MLFRSLAPLAPPPGSPWSPPAALAPLPDQAFAPSSLAPFTAPPPAALTPLLVYDGGDPFASSGDPFAALPASGPAFSASPGPAFSAGPLPASGDPFAVPATSVAPPVTSPRPQAPAPMPVAPAAPSSTYQKTMAALFEQAVIAQRGPA